MDDLGVPKNAGTPPKKSIGNWWVSPFRRWRLAWKWKFGKHPSLMLNITFMYVLEMLQYPVNGSKWLGGVQLGYIIICQPLMNDWFYTFNWKLMQTTIVLCFYLFMYFLLGLQPVYLYLSSLSSGRNHCNLLWTAKSGWSHPHMTTWRTGEKKKIQKLLKASY